MSRIEQIDVTLELPMGELERMPSHELERLLIEKLRRGAEDLVRPVGGHVVTDGFVEMQISKGSHVLLGGDWLLVAARWRVEVPEHAALAG